MPNAGVPDAGVTHSILRFAVWDAG